MAVGFAGSVTVIRRFAGFGHGDPPVPPWAPLQPPMSVGRVELAIVDYSFFFLQGQTRGGLSAAQVYRLALEHEDNPSPCQHDNGQEIQTKGAKLEGQ